jgi:spermidine synthase
MKAFAKVTILNPFRPTRLPALVLLYGAGTMVAQVLILRELLVLAQGQELKLALGLWCWLLWVGLGSLVGGRLAPAGSGPGRLGGLLALLGLLLPATLLAGRALPTLAHLPPGQAVPLSTTFLLFFILLAPFCIVSGFFFPHAVQVLSNTDANSQGTTGRVYYLETLGAAASVALLQLLFIGRFANLNLALGVGFLLALAPWLLLRPQTSVARVAITLNLLLLAAALVFSPRLEWASRTWLTPGRRLIATLDSPYALLSASREAGQTSFFANNLWLFTYPDPLTAEHQVQLALLESPHPRRVLLLGGGVAGLGAQILKTASVTHLDYVELDPFLVKMSTATLPAAFGQHPDPRLHLIYQDARRFLATTKNRYDVILMALPEPKSAQLNRFYTREFFRTVSRKLRPQGVFSFALPGAETSLNPLRAAYLAMAYHTLRQVFPDVVALPGQHVRFFASPTSGTLTTDPQILVQRLKQRHLALQYVREYYLLQDLSPWRQQYLHHILAVQPVEINTDLHPRCYFYDLVLSTFQEGLGVKDLLLALQNLPPWLPWMALVLATVLVGAAVRRRPGAAALYQVVIMGLSTLALEILVLILYQIRFGSLYQALGLLVAAFMAGMAAGSALWSRRPHRHQHIILAGLQGALALLAAGLALWLEGGVSIGGGWTLPIQAGYVLVLATAGFGGGGVFAISSQMATGTAAEARRVSGRLYAADLLGATLGTLGVSLLVLPVWGLVPTLSVVAFFQAGAGVLALVSLRS